MSLISFSATRSRAAAWLALLAVLLLFVAPVISKSLVPAHGGEMMMTAEEQPAPSATTTAPRGQQHAGTGHAPPDAEHHSASAQHHSGTEQHATSAQHQFAAEHHATSAQHQFTAEHHTASAQQISATKTGIAPAASAAPVMPAMNPMAMDHTAMGMMMPFHHPLSMMDDSACGYCVLLVHLALTLAVLPLLWSARQAAAIPAIPLLQAVVARFIPRFFHPRAPPAAPAVH